MRSPFLARGQTADFHLVGIIGEQAVPGFSEAGARHTAAGEEFLESKSTHAEDTFARRKLTADHVHSKRELFAGDFLLWMISARLFPFCSYFRRFQPQTAPYGSSA
jgi:hypothetical protein